MTLYHYGGDVVAVLTFLPVLTAHLPHALRASSTTRAHTLRYHAHTPRTRARTRVRPTTTPHLFDCLTLPPRPRRAAAAMSRKNSPVVIASTRTRTHRSSRRTRAGVLVRLLPAALHFLEPPPPLRRAYYYHHAQTAVA